MDESSDLQSSEDEANSVSQKEAEEEEELVDYGYEDETDICYDEWPSKRPRCAVDRISELPDSVISHILSLMPARDAFKTCILSKKWRHTWTSSSSLIYIFDGGSRKKFSKFVDKTLILHKSSQINKFVLKSFYRSIKESSVSLWVHAAVVKQVEELKIKFVNTDDTYIIVPQILYSCDSLKKLSLAGCFIAPIYSSVCWRSLKHLSLTSIELEADVLQKLLDGSPLLESLKLMDCTRFDHVDIHSGRLKKLVIKGYGVCNQYLDHGWLEINAPYLLSLEILGFVDRMKCKLKNVRSLVHASLTFHMGGWSSYQYEDDDDYQTRLEDDQSMVRDLTEKVRHVRNLTLGTWIVQVLSTCEVKRLVHCSISMRKCLVLEVDLHRFDLPGVAMLLRTSPILERLVIDLSRPHTYEQTKYFDEVCDIDAKNYWASKLMVLQCLRTVEVVGFAESVINCAQFLLQNAKALEKMIFTKASSYEEWQYYFGREDFFKTIQKLLSLPRSSPQAQIILL